MAKTKSKPKPKQFFDDDEITIAFPATVHVSVRVTTDPATGEVETEVTGWAIPSWMVDLDRESAETAFLEGSGGTISLKNIPDEVWDTISSDDSSDTIYWQ